MSAFCVFDVKKIKDSSLMEDYRNRVFPVVSQFGGRYLAAGGPWISVEGQPDVTFPVIIEFPNIQQAKQWYDSTEYAPLKKLREQAAETHAYFVEGL